MEGIVDGRAVDDCFYCALLYPEEEDCPHCAKRLHYQPARMSEGPSPSQRWPLLVQQFQAHPTAAHAQALLELVHQNPEELRGRLGTAGTPSIETLRELFSSPTEVERIQHDDE